MNRTRKALDLYLRSYACSQAILAVYAEAYQLDIHQALALSTGFAGGMASGKICGAVTGAIVVLGLHYGNEAPETPAGRRGVKWKVREFYQKFEALHQTTECSQLLQVNISTPEGMKVALEKNLFRTQCPQYIVDAVAILEELLEEVPIP
nr:C-GCAxxG-C-C family protein [uncultured Desulfobulbus sp.]